MSQFTDVNDSRTSKLGRGFLYEANIASMAEHIPLSCVTGITFSQTSGSFLAVWGFFFLISGFCLRPFPCYPKFRELFHMVLPAQARSKAGLPRFMRLALLLFWKERLFYPWGKDFGCFPQIGKNSILMRNQAVNISQF